MEAACSIRWYRNICTKLEKKKEGPVSLAFELFLYRKSIKKNLIDLHEQTFAFFSV